MQNTSIPFILFGLIIYVLICCIPIAISRSRDHRYKDLIAVITLLGAWVGFVWFAMLFWSIVGDSNANVRYNKRRAAVKKSLQISRSSKANSKGSFSDKPVTRRIRR